MAPFIFPHDYFIISTRELVGSSVRDVKRKVICAGFCSQVREAIDTARQRALCGIHTSCVTRVRRHVVTGSDRKCNGVLVSYRSVKRSCTGISVYVNCGSSTSHPASTIVAGVISVFRGTKCAMNVGAPCDGSLRPVNSLSLLRRQCFSFVVRLGGGVCLGGASEALASGTSRIGSALTALCRCLLSLSWVRA